MQIRSILCPTDLSDAARVGLGSAFSLARQYGAELVVLHVVPLSLAGIVARSKAELSRRTRTAVSRSIFEGTLADAESQIVLQIQSCLNRASPPMPWRLIITLGDVCHEIVRIARAENIGLIVITKKDRSVLGRLLHPSVSDRVSREAPCPVLSLRPTQKSPWAHGAPWPAFSSVVQEDGYAGGKGHQSRGALDLTSFAAQGPGEEFHLLK
ncbi:MAG TPA: universal stress protein [Candidatus Eisenbacteria bacterium]|nr:universal stress protein [Candidatus Eisenbacteria bacterium]